MVNRRKILLRLGGLLRQALSLPKFHSNECLFRHSPFQWLKRRLRFCYFVLCESIAAIRCILYDDLIALSLFKTIKNEESTPPQLTIAQLKQQSGIQEKITQRFLYDYAISHPNVNNCINRQLQTTCYDLYHFESIHSTTTLYNQTISLPKGCIRRCYGCCDMIEKTHANYLFSCLQCGNLFQTYRHYQTRQDGKIAVVIGARTKLGHQVVLKLLQSGAIVIATTRYPDKMKALFASYQRHDTNNTNDMSLLRNLIIYPGQLDLDSHNMIHDMTLFREWIVSECEYDHIDIYIHCAAQTIRCREKRETIPSSSTTTKSTETIEMNKYGDPKYVNSTLINSWQMCLHDLKQDEMEEIMRVNVIAPTLLIQTLLPLLQACKGNPYIINVHAREGLISVPKTPYHMHTNYGKASLHMLTKCLIAHRFHTLSGKAFHIHGCCPGFISIDEYYEDDRPWIVPPIDEVDGAARILFPLFQNLSSEWKTRRHFYDLRI